MTAPIIFITILMFLTPSALFLHAPIHPDPTQLMQMYEKCLIRYCLVNRPFHIHITYHSVLYRRDF